MPYKDAEDKRDWKFQGRSRRLARRRELRRIAAAQETQPGAVGVDDNSAVSSGSP